MAEADVADGCRLSAGSGWNQREEDWRLMLRLAEGRFRVAVDEGRVVATGGAVVYGRRLAWICMMLVDPERRGRGIGTRILQELLAGLGDVESVGLDATPAGRPVYARLGFEDAASLARMGAPTAERARPDDGAARPIGPEALDAVLELDRQVFGADRATVLRFALEQAPEYAWSLEENGRVSGYCFGRHGRHSDHVGPVVAASPEGGRHLVAACLRSAGDRRCIVDAAADSPDWIAELRALGFQEERRLTRMYHGGAKVPGRPGLQLAICGPELG